MLKLKRFGNVNEQEPNDQQQQADNQQQAEQVDNDKGTALGHENDGSQSEKFIPKSRFDEVNSKFKDTQEKLDKLLKEQEQRDLESKKKKGEFENLYNETSQELEKYKADFTQTSERVEQLEEIINTLVESELEAVPEELRDIVPENMTPEQKLRWITNAKKKGLFGTATNEKADQQLGDSTNPQQQQQVDMSKMTVSQLLKSAYGSK